MSRLDQRSTEELWILVNHISSQLQAVSEELVYLLEERLQLQEQIEMRKIAVDQLQQLQRMPTNDDVTSNDVTSVSKVSDNRGCGEAGDDGSQLRVTNEPPQ